MGKPIEHGFDFRWMSGGKDFHLHLVNQALFVHCRTSRQLSLMENLALNIRLQDGVCVENLDGCIKIKAINLGEIVVSIENQLKAMEVSFLVLEGLEPD